MDFHHEMDSDREMFSIIEYVESWYECGQEY